MQETWVQFLGWEDPQGKKPFLHTRAVMNADHLCPSWSAGNGLALEPHHIYRSKHKWLLPDCFMIH